MQGTFLHAVGGFPVISGILLILLGALGIAFIYILLTSKQKAQTYAYSVNHDLEESKERLTEAEKIGHFGSFIWDLQTHHHFWSDEMFMLHGIDKRMHKSTPTLEEFYSYVFTEDRERVQNEMMVALGKTGEFEINYRVELPTRALRWLTMRAKALGAPGDRIHLVHSIHGSVHDVTKEKEIDKAKTEFVSLASHQLKTPLTSINWYAEMLLDGDVGPLNADQKKYIQEMYESNQRMVDLVNSLLNVSRIELGTFSVEPVPTNIIDMVPLFRSRFI